MLIKRTPSADEKLAGDYIEAAAGVKNGDLFWFLVSL